MLRKFWNFLPRKTVKCQIFGIIYPYVIYAIEVLGSTKHTQLNRTGANVFF